MNTSFFWNRWSSPYRQLYWILLSVFILLLLSVLVSWAYGHELTISWGTNTSLEPTLVGIYDFSRSFFNFSVPSDTYLASDVYAPGAINVQPVFAYISLATIAFGFVWVISIVSFMELYWYMVGILALLGFAISLNLDVLEIAGRTDNVPLVLFFITYGGASYAFNSFGKNTSLLIRLCAFGLLTAAWAFVIGKFSALETPFLYLSAYSSMLPLWVMLLFVLIHGHYILKVFIFLVAGTARSNQESSLKHFSIAAGLYLVSLAMLLLKHLNVLELNLIYLHPYVLFILSSVIGIWQFKKQCELFGSNLPFVPAGALLYLALGCIAASGLSYACITDNFGFMQAYERLMLYGYLIFGFVFVIYVLINFGAFFNKRISIYDEIYNPTRMSFAAVPAIAITVIVVFQTYQHNYPYNLALSGRYTIVGDMYYQNDNIPLAIQYYSSAVGYDHPNPRANYAVASISQSNGDHTTAIEYYTNGAYRNPTPETLAGLANSMMSNGEYFQAIFKLQEAIRLFPERGELLNNLGMAYSKTNITDSTVYYLNKAAATMSNNAIPHSNLLYVLNKKGYGPLADSLSQAYQHSNSTNFEINRMATAQMNGHIDTATINLRWLQGKELNELQYAYVWNYSLLHPTWPPDLLSALQTDTNNLGFQDGLQYLQAWQLYRQGNALEAMTMLENLIAGTVQNHSFARTLGYWMLEQDDFQEAERLFKLTGPIFQFDDALNLALVQMRTNKAEAKTTLMWLTQHPDSTKRPVAASLLQMLESNPASAQNLPAGLKILYASLYADELSDEQIKALQASLPDPALNATIWADRLDYYTSRNDLAKASTWLSNAVETPNPASNYAVARYAFRSKNVSLLKQVANADLSRTQTQQYFKGYLKESEGKNLEAAHLYIAAIKAAPMYFEYYRQALNCINNAATGAESDSLKQVAYSLTVDAIRRKPDDLEVQRLFLEQCLNLGYTNYAESTLTSMRGRISALEEARYRKVIDSLLQ